MTPWTREIRQQQDREAAVPLVEVKESWSEKGFGERFGFFGLAPKGEHLVGQKQGFPSDHLHFIGQEKRWKVVAWCPRVYPNVRMGAAAGLMEAKTSRTAGGECKAATSTKFLTSNARWEDTGCCSESQPRGCREREGDWRDQTCVSPIEGEMCFKCCHVNRRQEHRVNEFRARCELLSWHLTPRSKTSPIATVKHKIKHLRAIVSRTLVGHPPTHLTLVPGCAPTEPFWRLRWLSSHMNRGVGDIGVSLKHLHVNNSHIPNHKT